MYTEQKSTFLEHQTHRFHLKYNSRSIVKSYEMRYGDNLKHVQRRDLCYPKKR